MNIAFDTNVLAYAEGVNRSAMRDRTIELIERLTAQTRFVPAQALGELFFVLQRKANRSAAEAKASVLQWVDANLVISTTHSTILSAADLVEDHQLNFWDALILSCAAQTQCRLLLSEEMQDGFTWRGTTIVNPYASTPNPILTSLLT